MLKGLLSPVLTPFNDDMTLATDLYVEFSRRLLSTGGCAGLVPFGTTGEALSVSMAERMAALDALVDGGIDPQIMIPGTGLANLDETVVLTRHAVEHGCYGAMILPPFYYKGVSDEGLYRYYSALIDGVAHNDLKIYLYHIPQASGVGLSIDLVRRLHDTYSDTIVGIKDSSGDWDNTAALLSIDGLITYPGAELPMIEAVKMGAPGCISATANLNGNRIAEVIDLCHKGDFEAAAIVHEEVKAIRYLFQDYAPIPSQKALLARGTGDKRWNNLRPPLLPMAPSNVAELEKTLREKHDFIIR